MTDDRTTIMLLDDLHDIADELERRLKGHTMAGARIQPYRDEADFYRWRRIAENGNIIADSGEGYVNKRDMLEMAKANFPDDPFDWALLPDPDALINDGVSEDGDE